MFHLIQSPFHPEFKKFAESISTHCLICSPYITNEPIRMLVETIARKDRGQNIQINVLTDISRRTLVQGGTEISALLYLLKEWSNVRITYLPKLHAKVYISNGSTALIASANFTRGGGQNFEYGIRISDRKVVRKIHNDMNAYKNLGVDVTQSELEILDAQVEEIQDMIETEKRSISRKINLCTTKQEQKIEDNLIRARVKHKSVNVIFSETIVYLLSNGPATTKALNEHIRDIHSDLCGDEDRVIDGVHYGKRWKHDVRNAQQHLKKAGFIINDPETKLWRAKKK